MSYTRDSRGLDPTASRRGASRATQWHARVAAIAACAVVVGTGSAQVGCATTPTTVTAPIDVMDRSGRTGRVGAPGRVTILDVCTSWDAACNVNARALDEVMRKLGDRPVDVITVLLDEGEVGRVALDSYAHTLGIAHATLLAGPSVRAGTSALGDVGYVPRLVVIDQRGRIRMDDSGGVIDVEFLVERVDALVRER